VRSIVIAPANTGRERRSKKAVNNTPQVKRGIISKERPEPRMLAMVVMKLIDPRMEEMPAR